MITFILLLGGISSALFLSSVAGFGGSLILTPLLVLTLGAKQGIALSALILATHNGIKLIAYRSFLPIKASMVITGATLAGVFIGSVLLVAMPDKVAIFLLIFFSVTTLLFEVSHQFNSRTFNQNTKALSPWIAFLSGIASGSSGTSGPLKGLAVKNLQLDCLEHVGAASIVSFAGDVLKAGVFSSAGLLNSDSLTTLAFVTPLMPICAFAGLAFNKRFGDKAFAAIFWVLIGGYILRTIGVLS
jgi:uncharacterized membrane protein YfcA